MSEAAFRIAQERREARELMVEIARRFPNILDLVEPDNDDPEGTPPELLARSMGGHEYVLTIAPADGWEIAP